MIYCHLFGIITASLLQFSIFNSIETHQLHIVYFQWCNMSRIYINFSIFNSIETHQLHIVYFQWCNMSRLYINFQLSIFNFHLM